MRSRIIDAKLRQFAHDLKSVLNAIDYLATRDPNSEFFLHSPSMQATYAQHMQTLAVYTNDAGIIELHCECPAEWRSS